MAKHLFQLKDKVKLQLSDEKGVVIGIAIYSEEATQYYVRFLAGDGCQRQAWFTTEAITKDTYIPT